MQPLNARVSVRAVLKASSRTCPEPGLQGNVSINVSIPKLNTVSASWVDVSDLSVLQITLASWLQNVELR